jgi:MFS family permease
VASLPKAVLFRHTHAARLGAVLLAGLLLRLPTFSRPFLSTDESVYGATADAMRRGAVLYRDIVDHKPPAIYDVFLASFELLGPYHTQLAHLLVIVAALLIGLALSRAAVRTTSDTRSGWMAALLFVVFSTTMPDFDALAANCELFLLAAQAAAFAWLLDGLGGRGGQSRRTLFGVGVLTGVAVAFKYQGATFLAVVGGTLALEVWWRRRTVLGALAGLAVTLAGCAIVPAVYIARAWLGGGLDAMWFWFRFNFVYLDAGPRGLAALRLGLLRTALLGAAAFLPYAFGLTGTWRTIREWWRRGTARPDRPEPEPELAARALAVIWLASSVIALVAGFRFFGHYFHLVLPALCVLAAGPLLAFWDRFGRLRPAITLLLVAPALAALAVSTVLRTTVVGRFDPKPPYATVAARLQEISSPDDTIFVWGHSTELYVLAERQTGTRFSFCDYLTGASPGTRTATALADPSPNVVASAWKMLFDDLARRRPRFLVDPTPAGWDGYGLFPLARYPRLYAYVRAHYVERDHVGGVVIYERSAR